MGKIGITAPRIGIAWGFAAALMASGRADAADTTLDAFGIRQFHPTRTGTREWNSAHWGNGTARLVGYAGDPYDPTGWTDNHSTSSSDSLFIDGKGSLLINGSGPRFHVNSTGLYWGTPPTPKVPAQAFVNLEATGYARRLSSGGSPWDGMEIQVRTGPLSHGSAGGNACDATGYASRFRDDGNWDWEKELKHPDSRVYSIRAGVAAALYPGKPLPIGRWIGMKFLAYNVDGGLHVRLETYIDTLSDVGSAPPAGGGHWELVGAMVDDGANFPGGDVSGCPGLTPSMAITEGHGTMLIRTDYEACEWKFVSLREIDPTVTTALLPLRSPAPRAFPDGNPGAWLWDGRFDAQGRSGKGKPAHLPEP
jgi:hypothetical protein